MNTSKEILLDMLSRAEMGQSLQGTPPGGGVAEVVSGTRQGDQLQRGFVPCTGGIMSTDMDGAEQRQNAFISAAMEELVKGRNNIHSRYSMSSYGTQPNTATRPPLLPQDRVLEKERALQHKIASYLKQSTEYLGSQGDPGKSRRAAEWSPEQIASVELLVRSLLAGEKQKQARMPAKQDDFIDWNPGVGAHPRHADYYGREYLSHRPGNAQHHFSHAYPSTVRPLSYQGYSAFTPQTHKMPIMPPMETTNTRSAWEKVHASLTAPAVGQKRKAPATPDDHSDETDPEVTYHEVSIDYDQIWHSRCDQLEEYIAKHGALPRTGGTSGIGKWINKQRTEYKRQNHGSLTKERIDRLNGIPEWSWDPFDDTWKKHCHELQLYVERHNHLPLQSDATGLGKWINKQRTQYKRPDHGSLTDERIRALEDIPGWTWDASPDHDAMWLTRYNELKAYILEHDSLPPYRSTSGIGVWISNQRKQYNKPGHGSLSDERITMLEDLPYWIWRVR